MEVLTAASPRISLRGGPITLRDHQLAMVARCQRIEAASDKAASDKARTGLIADKPGAGKSYVVLALILADKHASRASNTPGINIIVVPQNIHTQWVQAADKFSDLGGGRRALTYRTFVDYAEVTSLYFGGGANLEHRDIFITTPLYYNVVADALAASFCAERSTIRRVVIDEPDNGVTDLIKSHAACGFRWLVSASLLGNRRELGDEYYVPDRDVCKCDDAFVDAGFPLPEPLVNRIMCRSRVVDMLPGVVSAGELGAAAALDFTAIRLDNLKQVAESETQVLDFLVRDMVLSVEKETRELECLRLQIRDAADERSRKLLRQRVVASDASRNEATRRLELVRSRLKERKACLICYEDFLAATSQIVTSCCQNAFCADCLLTWYGTKAAGGARAKCPLCRAEAALESHVVLLPGSCPKAEEEPEPAQALTLAEAPPLQPPPEKLDAVRDLLLTDKTGTDVIVFSSHTSIFKRIGTMLREEGIECIELDGGNIAAIDRAVARYKSGGQQAGQPPQKRVLMASSTLHGCGLNLENTTDVVMVHAVGASTYNQVVGRAQRPGRTSQLRVHELLFAHEIIAPQPQL